MQKNALLTPIHLDYLQQSNVWCIFGKVINHGTQRYTGDSFDFIGIDLAQGQTPIKSKKCRKTNSEGTFKMLINPDKLMLWTYNIFILTLRSTNVTDPTGELACQVWSLGGINQFQVQILRSQVKVSKNGTRVVLQSKSWTGVLHLWLKLEFLHQVQHKSSASSQKKSWRSDRELTPWSASSLQLVLPAAIVSELQ